MPDYPIQTLYFPLPENYDKLTREQKGRVLVHLFIEHGKRKWLKLAVIQGEYTGAGDSWDGATFTLYGQEEGMATLDGVMQLELHNDVLQALEDFLSEWVSDEHPGWENNDGGFGTMTIDLIKRSITLEHNERYTTSEVEGNYTLFDDSEEKPDD